MSEILIKKNYLEDSAFSHNNFIDPPEINSDNTPQTDTNSQKFISKQQLMREVAIGRTRLYEYINHDLIEINCDADKSNQECYSVENIDRIKQIRQLTKLGYELAEIKNLIENQTVHQTLERLKQALTRQELMELTDSNKQHILKLEQKGLIQALPNTRFRYYDSKTVEQIHLIKKMLPICYTYSNVASVLNNEVAREMIVKTDNLYTLKQLIRLSGLTDYFVEKLIEKKFIKALNLNNQVSCYDSQAVDQVIMMKILVDKGIRTGTILNMIEDSVLETAMPQLQNLPQVISLSELVRATQTEPYYIRRLSEKQLLTDHIADIHTDKYYFKSSIVLVKNIKFLTGQGIGINQIRSMINESDSNLQCEVAITMRKNPVNCLTLDQISQKTNINPGQLQRYYTAGLLPTFYSGDKTRYFELQSTLERIDIIQRLSAKKMKYGSIKAILNSPDILDKIDNNQILNLEEIAHLSNQAEGTVRIWTNDGLISTTSASPNLGFWYDREVIQRIKNIQQLFQQDWTKREVLSALDTPIFPYLKNKRVIPLNRLLKITTASHYEIIQWTHQKLLTVLYVDQDNNIAWYPHQAIEQIAKIQDYINRGRTNSAWVKSQLSK
ncbi:MAG: MerR family transcriptional regulator [Candidatus Saccharibacteria bacterium]|nr:MerR family transcriptional regulator [Candidatus Saccharibacteria bacterium]